MGARHRRAGDTKSPAWSDNACSLTKVCAAMVLALPRRSMVLAGISVADANIGALLCWCQNGLPQLSSRHGCSGVFQDTLSRMVLAVSQLMLVLVAGMLVVSLSGVDWALEEPEVAVVEEVWEGMVCRGVLQTLVHDV